MSLSVSWTLNSLFSFFDDVIFSISQTYVDIPDLIIISVYKLSLISISGISFSAHHLLFFQFTAFSNPNAYNLFEYTDLYNSSILLPSSQLVSSLLSLYKFHGLSL